MKRVYMEAVLRRGIPKLVYLDNGKVYRSKLFHTACASMGTIVSHTEPYDAASKGKIERFFGTVRDRFLPLLDYPVNSLSVLNRSFWRWLEEDYHRRVHSSLNMSPLDKYLSQINQIKLVKDPESLRRLFMKRETRRVNNDATISVSGRFFEVPPVLIGQRIEVRFEPENLDEVLIFVDSECLGKAVPVRLSDNARIKRDRKGDSPAPALSFHEALLKREGDS
jgi:putative transposase